MELSIMMKFWKHLLLMICLFGIQTNCGSERRESSLFNITSPDDIEISVLEYFWLYEAHPALSEFFNMNDHEGAKYFPELMPVSSKDFFWVVSPRTKTALIPDPFSRHIEGVISRVSFPITSPADSSAHSKGDYAILSFVHELFEGMDQDSIRYAVRPTFEIKGVLGDSAQAVFISTLVCFRTDAASENPMMILDRVQDSLTKNFVVTRTQFESETYVMDLSFDNTKIGPFYRICQEKNGKVGSEFRIEISPTKVTDTLTIDFPGIFVSRQGA